MSEKALRDTLPGDWGVTTISKTSSIVTGSRDTQDKLARGKYPFFVRSQTVERIDSFVHDGIGILTAGDGVGTGKVFHFIDGKFDFHQRVYCLKDFKNYICPRYLFEYFRQNFIFRVNKFSAKGSVDSVRMEMIADMEVPLPPLAEQEKIAAILTSVDEVIEKSQAQIDKLQDLKRATMNQLLTRGINHTEFKDSPLGKIPKAWEVKSFEQICRVSSSKRVMLSEYVAEGIPFFRSKEIIQKAKGEKPNDILYISEERFENLKHKFGAPNKGDILITAVGTIGVSYLIQDEKFYFKDGNLLWLKEFKNVIPDFIETYLTAESIHEKIIQISGGSSQSALTIEKLKEFPVVIPPASEQVFIADTSKCLSSAINDRKARLDKIKALKKALMQDLLTGKKRVKI